MNRTWNNALAMLLATTLGSPAAAGLLGTYELTGGSLAPTDADAGDGVTLSDLDLNSYTPAQAFDGDGDSIRLDGVESPNGSGSAFSGGLYLSFTVTNNSGVDLDFESLGLDYKGTNVFQNFASRIYTTNSPGDIVDDTIGRVGKANGGTDDSFMNDLGLLDGTDPAAGVNTVGVPTSVADGASITFYLPFNMNSNSTSRFMDIDNITISSITIPEPGAAVLMMAGLLGGAVRRR